MDSEEALYKIADTLSRDELEENLIQIVAYLQTSNLDDLSTLEMRTYLQPTGFQLEFFYKGSTFFGPFRDKAKVQTFRNAWVKAVMKLQERDASMRTELATHTDRIKVIQKVLAFTSSFRATAT